MQTTKVKYLVLWPHQFEFRIRNFCARWAGDIMQDYWAAYGRAQGGIDDAFGNQFPENRVRVWRNVP